MKQCSEINIYLGSMEIIFYKKWWRCWIKLARFAIFSLPLSNRMYTLQRWSWISTPSAFCLFRYRHKKEANCL